MNTRLSSDEKRLLRECEQDIADACVAQGDLDQQRGEKLKIIRDQRLYRAEYPTFEQYCDKRWHLSGRHARRLIGAIDTKSPIGPLGPVGDLERHTRELAGLTPESAQTVLKMVDGKPTAAKIRDARIASGATGINAPASVEEVNTRRKHVKQLFDDGYSRDAACAALSISHGTLSSDEAVLGISRGRGRQKRTRADPPSLPWRNEPVPPRAPKPPPKKATPNTPIDDEPAYQHSFVISLMHSMLADLASANSVNRFANDVADAIKADDSAWLRNADDELVALRTYLDRLLSVVRDHEARKRGMNDWRERDDMAQARRREMRAL